MAPCGPAPRGNVRNPLLIFCCLTASADFGLAIKCDEERPVTRAGTLDYMPPEVLVCPTKHEPEDGRDVTSPAYGPPVMLR